MAAYQISVYSPTVYFMLKTTNVSFGGKLVSKGTSPGWNGCGECVTLAPVAQDRLGSIGKYYPYGQERPSATANDTEKFTGYFRDAATGLDYADQRYHQPGVGRFMTPDSAASAKPNDPGSSNKYAYAGGDPVNRTDRTGQDWEDPWGGLDGDWGGFDPFGFLGREAQDDAWSVWYGIAIYDQSIGNCSLGKKFFEDLLGGGTGDFCDQAADDQPPPSPDCGISLWERWVPTKDAGAFHTYLYVTNTAWGNQGELIEGGPTTNFIFSRLIGYDTNGPGQGLGKGTSTPSNPFDSSNVKLGPTYTGPDACDKISQLESKVDKYDAGPLRRYNFLAVPGTYNSNSFTYTLLRGTGLLGYFHYNPLPLTTPGWGKSVPGL